LTLEAASQYGAIAVTTPTSRGCRMLEARIVSPKESLYIAADATPFDVHELRRHVRAFVTTNAADVQLTVRLGPNSLARVRELVATLAATLAAERISVTVDDGSVTPDDRVRHRPVGARGRRDRYGRGVRCVA